MVDDKRSIKQKLRLRKYDAERALRVVEHIEAPSILRECPIEPIECFVFADRDEHAVFLSYCFKNISDKAITRLDVRIDFYYYQNIPYCSTEFSYCQSELSFGIISRNGKPLDLKRSSLRESVESGEIFGEKILIPITDIRYTKMKLVLVSSEFADGTKKELGIAVDRNARRIDELDRVSRLVFDRGDTAVRSRAVFPAKNIPQFGDSAWLCCCGNKNSVFLDRCERCQREKAVQQELLSDSALEKRKNELVSTPSAVLFHDKTKFRQNKYLENEHDLKKKRDMAERAMKKVLEDQGTRKTCGVVIRFEIWVIVLNAFFGILGLAVVLYLALRDPGEDSVNFSKFIQKLLDGDF